MHELTDERLAELRKIAEETRPGGGWTADVYQVNDEDGHQVYGADAYGDGTSPAAEHIAAFDPPTVLALLAEVERLREERDDMRRRLDAVEARHTPVTVRYGDAPDELACRACGTHYEYPVAWPCPTVKAARGRNDA